MPSLVRPYFEGLLLALLAAGFFTLVGTGRMGTGVAIAGTLVLALRGWLLWRGRRPDLPPHWVTLTALLYFLFYPVDVYLVSNSFIEATVHLVLFVAVVKLFTASQARDYVYLCVIAFLEVLAAATLTVGSDFFAFFSLFLLLTIATLVAFEAFRAEDRSRIVARTDAPQFTGRLRASLFGVSAGLAASVLLTGCLIFFMLPRMAHSYWHPNYGGARLTGFSDEVHLGEVGRLQQTNQTVMHIRELNPDSSFSGLPFAQPLLWRGRALSFFTGTSWLDPHRSRIVPTQSGTFQFGQLSIPSLPHHFLRYRISLEPIGSDVLFTAPQLREIDTRYANLGLDAAGTISTLGRSMAGAEYAATSDISIPPDRFLRNLPPGKPLAPPSEYLQLPQNLDPRIPELARSITRRQTSTIDRMRALEIYLRSHFRYTLKLEPTGPDPLADFMFRVKAGHCEYFASALAVMARSLGIPARVVNGFQMGQFNQVSGEYVVRGRDAHSWVEAYFPVVPAAAGLPTRGVWIPFDGTAGNPEAVAASWSRAMLYLDALQSFWQEWVINYDWAHQLNLAQRTQASLHRNTENARDWLRNAPHDWEQQARHFAGQIAVLWTAAWQHPFAPVPSPNTRSRALMAVILLLLLATWLRTSRGARFLLQWRALGLWRGGTSAWRTNEAARYFLQLQRILARAGYPREPHETAEDILDRLPLSPMTSPITAFLADYQAARFGTDLHRLLRLPEDLAAVRRARQRRTS
ncbi:MAG: transglutaminase family protein [Terriglobales bacterium]